MKTLLLLAGQSKRFAPLSAKALFPICGKPLVGHIVERLQKAGCKDITLVGGAHNLDEVRGLFPKLGTTEQENLSLGMRGALLSALPALGSEAVLVVSANDVIDSHAYSRVVELGKKKKNGGALLAQQVERYFPGGYLSVTDGRITGIVEKPGAGKEPTNLVNIVCHYHSDASALLDALQNVDESRDDGYEQALHKLFSSHDYTAVANTGPWNAVKYPWHLLPLVEALLKDQKRSIHRSAVIHKSAVIEGNVVIDEGVRVLPNACIMGPCFIGAHSVIGNNALVRGSSVGEHCVVGYNTEVKSSVLHSHVWTHSTYLGDSVVGENVSFGGGTVTGNFRLDEEEIHSDHAGQKIPTGLSKFGTIIGDDCRIGIHVAINPGCKIGGGSFVSSGTLVDHDIPGKSFARMKDGILTVSDNRTDVKNPHDRAQFKRKI